VRVRQKFWQQQHSDSYFNSATWLADFLVNKDCQNDKLLCVRWGECDLATCFVVFVLQSYVSCTVGIQYVGYCMITLGVANAVCSCLIGCAQRHVHREALVAIGCVLHAALIIFLLVWIPDRHLPVFFVISALWGFCQAIWQTQSNGLYLLISPNPNYTWITEQRQATLSSLK